MILTLLPKPFRLCFAFDLCVRCKYVNGSLAVKEAGAFNAGLFKSKSFVHSIEVIKFFNVNQDSTPPERNPITLDLDE